MGTTASLQQGYPPVGGGYSDNTQPVDETQNKRGSTNNGNNNNNNVNKRNSVIVMELKPTSEPVFSTPLSSNTTENSNGYQTSDNPQIIYKDADDDENYYKDESSNSALSQNQRTQSATGFSTWKTSMVQSARSSISLGLESYNSLFSSTTRPSGMSSSPPSPASAFPTSLRERSPSTEDYQTTLFLSAEKEKEKQQKDLLEKEREKELEKEREPVNPLQLLEHLYELPEIEVRQEGFLRKQAVGKELANNYSLWKERYFILHRGSLTWYQLGLKGLNS
eukprot:TRINITY_DN5922_c0_g1_i1.p1 TRINITY_DN5922_c0_g1~~TRINITY_DN5922_c0_g1_i1.p1  ORF type:complete len:288 (-),score=89.28 TRINITY_DN5922_c0_g1_i1:734-1570(-)